VRALLARLALLLAGASAVALAGAGCSASLNFTECNVDADCARRAPMGADPNDMFCTSAHYCVYGLPDERLCTWGGGVNFDRHPAVVAGLFRLSGAADSKDTAMAQAAQLAAREVAQDNQRPIALLLCDTAGPKQPDGTTQAQRALRRAVEAYGAVASVGPTTSGDTNDVAPYAVQKNVLIVSPSATSPLLTSLADANLVWRTAASDNLQAKVLAARATALAPGAMPLNIAYVDSIYGNGLEQTFLTAWGGQPKRTVRFPEGAADPVMVETQLAMDTPTVSVLVADADAAALVHALATAPTALSATKFLMTDGAKGLDLLSMPVASVLSRVSGTGPGVDTTSSVFTAFRGAYMFDFGQDPASTSFVVNTYDAFYVVALALSASTSPRPNGTELAVFVSKMSSPGIAVNVGPVDFVKGLTTLHDGGTIDVRGTSGPLDFDNATGDVLSAPIEVWAIDTTNPTMPKYVTQQIVVP
jgi:branched-chain amino acid transport system substrate-binding protein